MTMHSSNRRGRGPIIVRTEDTLPHGHEETTVIHTPTGGTTGRRVTRDVDPVYMADTPVVGSPATRRTVVHDIEATRRRKASQATQILWFVVGLIEALLCLRVALKALGANLDAGFVEFIYAVTQPLMWPFAGMFASPASGGFELELSSLAAMFVYFLLGLGLARLVWILYGEPRELA